MDVHIRHANRDDVPIIANFTYEMLAEMASMGGRLLVEEFQAKASLAARVRSCLAKDEHLFYLAESLAGNHISIGYVEARIIIAEPFFEFTRILHIHSLYVLPSYRRVGIGSKLIQAALDWGHEWACVEAELNTLVWNPARSLYKQLGFQVSEYRMSINLFNGNGG